MNARDRVRLLFGPYKAPALRKGDRASCLYRDQDVKIIGLDRCSHSLAAVPSP